MKKMIVFFFLLFSASFIDAKICTFACSISYSNAAVGVGYAWSVAENSPCGGRPPKNTKVYYAIAVDWNGDNEGTMIMAQGVYDNVNNGIAC